MGLRRGDQAGHDRLSIQPDRAGAALAFGAALLGAGQPGVLPQRVQQRFGVRARQGVRLAVDDCANRIERGGGAERSGWGGHGGAAVQVAFLIEKLLVSLSPCLLV